MRTLSLAWAVVCALALVGPAQADPLKIRGAWVAPVSNWASIWLAKKDLAKHFGQVLRIRTDAFCRHTADGHGDRQQ